ncbi:hypothetical protein QNI19_09070 [Cytophagaceae bacterium DM2B3-1]|uniref:Uncharacterized protein n=1 Tax=Xanthocytophaga flava TaxID=3048013 RepID=A0ABT7CH65_9BACT|nr:hypothetical protein [Xanthocytophaga flavus]MDJ1493082.1 hypothetical protein [Xanthocytophaga flavus]
MIAAIQIVSPTSARVSTTGEDSKSLIELYPNSFVDQLTLKVTSITGLAYIRVTDLIG